MPPEDETGRRNRGPRWEAKSRPRPHTREAVQAAELEEQIRRAAYRQRLCCARRAAVTIDEEHEPLDRKEREVECEAVEDPAVFRSTVN